MGHSHDFDIESWPFEKSVNSPVFSTKNVIDDEYPILTVSHDDEGDWQFLCRYTDEAGDMSIICFGCMYEKHPFIAQFHDLPRGWIAWRQSENDDWQTEPLANSED